MRLRSVMADERERAFSLAADKRAISLWRRTLSRTI
jgi:hypothetical protein